jgi:protein TonB
VARVTVARSGQVVDIRISTSSGWPAIDAAEVETIRKAAPFPPLPNDMPGETVILMLPVNFNYAPGR